MTPHPGDIDSLARDLTLFSDARVAEFPAWESEPGERVLHDEIYGERLRVLKQLGAGSEERGAQRRFSSLAFRACCSRCRRARRSRRRRGSFASVGSSTSRSLRAGSWSGVGMRRRRSSCRASFRCVAAFSISLRRTLKTRFALSFSAATSSRFAASTSPRSAVWRTRIDDGHDARTDRVGPRPLHWLFAGRDVVHARRAERNSGRGQVLSGANGSAAGVSLGANDAGGGLHSFLR